MGAVRGLTLLPLLCFPFIAHIGAVQALYWPVVLCWVLWLLLLAWQPRLPPAVRAGGLVVGLALLATVVRYPQLGEHLLPLPSLLIFLSLAWVFGMTLRPGFRPLVTRIAAALGDPLDEALLRYTRQVTVAWCALFLALAMASLAVWFFGSHAQWSVFTNFIAYGLVLVMFALEYGVRRRRFAFARAQGFVDFLRALIKIRPHELWR